MEEQEGFFQIICNEYSYGEYYSDELENIMDTVSVFDWFERMIRVVVDLEKYNYIKLSDTESFNKWIEFVRDKDNRVTVGVIKSEKVIGSTDIEYDDTYKEYAEWSGQRFSFNEIKYEVKEKAQLYCKVLNGVNEKEEKKISLLIDKIII